MSTKIFFLYDGHTPTTSLCEAIQKIHADLPGQFQCEIARQRELDADEQKYDEALQQAKDSHLIFIVAHGGITYFKKFTDFFSQRMETPVFMQTGIPEEVQAVFPQLGLSNSDYATLYQYYSMGGCDNYYNMLLFIAEAFAGQGPALKSQPPKPPKWEGLYHPELSETELIKAAQDKTHPVIAVLFHYANWANRNLRHIDALIQAIESQGAIAYPIYTGVTREPELGNQGIAWTLENRLYCDGQLLADVLVNTIGHSMTVFDRSGKPDTDNSPSVFEDLKIPVLQAFSTFFTYEQWKESIVGLDSMALTSAIYFPEMDGQIGGYPIASHEYDKDAGAYVACPIGDRIEKMASLAIRWARLHRKKNSDKKVAILFHNMPPRNDAIGCAWGLDSPATVFNILNRLEKSGVDIGEGFNNGDEIIHQIIDKVSNDSTWKSLEEQLQLSVDTIDRSQYEHWFADLPEKVTHKMETDWGKAPGQFMVHDDKMPVPGILTGNVFIGLQPPRAFTEKAEEAYHSTDIVCPHQYLGYYRWIKHVFGADVIMHIGTHGTLEWLPGKEKGLSNECYPDITIDDLPHLYVYNISVVGEGIQAKRRSSAVLLDHNIPSLTESGVYQELSELDELLKEYQQSRHFNPNKISLLEEKIWQLTLMLNLHQDLNIQETEKPKDFADFLKKLHAWMEKIKMSVIKDGLHVFGCAPTGDRLMNLLRQLVRIKNGAIPSLQEGIASALGYSMDAILDNPALEFHPGVDGYLLLEQFTEHSKTLVDGLHQSQYCITNYDEFLTTQLPKATNGCDDLKSTLSFICDEIKPRLDRMTEELDYAETGTQAGFVSPGPGGCPTRGNALILPSGKNFFAIDPAIIPTRASWEVGKKMASDLINRYYEEEQKYPESLAIVLYAGDQMRTNGDDIAEVLYLLGVKPKWLGNTERVCGIEVMPLEELQRPRIDVTCRISGLFRDTFPNLIELLDQAVTQVAGLDESREDNYIRKHYLEEVQELTSQGISQSVAEQESLIRVFGCPPGNYGGGVDILIESKKWEDRDDLAKISVNWSCHAYGKHVHGDKRPDTYTRRLSKTEVTVKNEMSVESDIYDIDDEFIYHGGLLAAVTMASGQKPRSYYGNSSNPERTSIADIQEETARIMRARILNPKWIEGLKQHGYKGAQDVAYTIDNVFGWDATANVVEDWMYEQIANHFLLDAANKQWMDEVNPYASMQIVERLLEAAQREMWDAKDETIHRLKELYLECEGILELNSEVKESFASA